MTVTAPSLRKIVARAMAGKSPLANDALRLKTCIFKLDRIGDFVLALSAIRKITQHYGEENCALVVYKLVAELAQREFPKATIISLPRCDGGIKNSLFLFLSESRKFRNYQFENLICLRYQRALAHHLVLSWVHANYSAGVKETLSIKHRVDDQTYQFPFTEIFSSESVATGNLCGELRRHQQFVGGIIRKEISNEGILPVLISERSGTGRHLLVTPFSSARIKDFPSDVLMTSLFEIRKVSPMPILLCGAVSEKPGLDELHRQACSQGISNIETHVSPSLSDFIKTIAEAEAVLTVDTASAHIATALDKPTVVILGGGHFGDFGPWRRSPRQIWLSNSLPCFGCNWQCVHNRPLCITEISPATIVKAILEVSSC